MIAIRSLRRGACRAGLVLSVTLLGAWGLPAGDAYGISARHAAIVSEPNQIGDAPVMLVRGTDKESEAAGLGVNSFLWRASLDTVSFMPLTTVDSVGGVIITDWRSNPKAPDERFKLTVYVLDKRLRADGVKVAVFRQVRSGAQNWVDAVTNPETATRLENAILTRARQYKFDATGQE